MFGPNILFFFGQSSHVLLYAEQTCHPAFFFTESLSQIPVLYSTVLTVFLPFFLHYDTGMMLPVSCMISQKPKQLFNAGCCFSCSAFSCSITNGNTHFLQYLFICSPRLRLILLLDDLAKKKKITVVVSQLLNASFNKEKKTSTVPRGPIPLQRASMHWYSNINFS
ncbi:hypothetical protein DM01DRAFT_1168062 [Hesseltinella vesiculosa]|uniref:Uncharacterized protein n=1 Tax=Hesseltinella vesiculosa TaxID=101127 RepID=A0A1X2G617_9FUNG|nr:hypothetical protein DM01DRAFT_1168062 [Hesseltinella vesiculosa]